MRSGDYFSSRIRPCSGNGRGHTRSGRRGGEGRTGGAVSFMLLDRPAHNLTSNLFHTAYSLFDAAFPVTPSIFVIICHLEKNRHKFISINQIDVR